MEGLTAYSDTGKAIMDQKQYSILIVDDSETDRALLYNYLDELNCNITHAVDGEDAVELCESTRFDLIMMDIIMPLMDGVDAIREIRKIEIRTGRTKTPILALSAEESVETGVDSMSAGATRMQTKPLTRQGFLNTVKELLENGS
jgi:CheY-like chemotaxis protein